MQVLVTGANGIAGRFLTHRLLADGHEVMALGRTPLQQNPAAFFPFDLAGPAPVLPGAEVLVHAAFHHERGKYRGGEGADPERFHALNGAGTERLFQAARAAGLRHVVFLSSRAIYGDHRQGEVLRESDPVQPDTHYGRVKKTGEDALKSLCGPGFFGTVLRPTGLYGAVPGRMDHKWTGLFEEFLSGRPVAPRCGTELHGEDLAAAVSLLLSGRRGGQSFEIYNASDLLVDRRDLLGRLQTACGRGGPLPEASSARPSVMETARLEALGWRPGGSEKLNGFVEACARAL